MKAPDSYRLWLARRLEEGNDIERVRRQIEAWTLAPPAETTAGLFVSMLAELNAKHRPDAAPVPVGPPASDAGAFD